MTGIIIAVAVLGFAVYDIWEIVKFLKHFRGHTGLIVSVAVMVGVIEVVVWTVYYTNVVKVDPTDPTLYYFSGAGIGILVLGLIIFSVKQMLRCFGYDVEYMYQEKKDMNERQKYIKKGKSKTVYSTDANGVIKKDQIKFDNKEKKK